MKRKFQRYTPKQLYIFVLPVFSAIGMVASFWQASERIHMLKNPDAALGCNLNPIVDCGSVLGHRLSALFGFPNAFIGMVVFAMLLMAGVQLASGGKLTKSAHMAVLVLSAVLFGFSAWFFGTSLYIIHKICIFCIFIWLSSVPIFWYGLLYWLQAYPSKNKYLGKLKVFGDQYHRQVVLAIYAVMVFLFLAKFREYYFN